MANGKKKYGDWRDTVDPGKVDTFNQTKAIIKKNWSLTKPGRVVAPVKPAEKPKREYLQAREVAAYTSQ